jgi:hypothetical protein
MRYSDLFEVNPVRRYLSDVKALDKVKKIWAASKPKAFTAVKPLEGIAVEPTAAPKLKRGAIVDSPALLKSFVAHSSIAISQSLFDEICTKYPDLANPARKYAERCGMKVAKKEEAVDIQSLMSSFSLKRKFLMSLCSGIANGPHIEILRMLMFQQLSALKSNKRWFYFLRFLRLTLVTDEKKAEGYRRNTREWMKDVLGAFTAQSDVIAHELCALLQAVCPPDEIRQKSEQKPQLAPIVYRTFQEADYFTEVPSLILDIVAHHTQYPKADVVRLIDDRKVLILSEPILAETMVGFLRANPTFTSKVESFLPALLDPSSGLFVSGASWTVQLLSQWTGSLGNYESAMTLIRVGGYSPSCSVPISSAYYRARLKLSPAGDSAQRLKMQELLQLTELFLQNPDSQTCQELSAVLVDSGKFFDSTSLLLGRVAAIDSRFAWVAIVAGRYLAAVAEPQRGEFATRVSETHALAPKSRTLALKCVTEGHNEEAFAYANAETGEESVLDRIAQAARA